MRRPWAESSISVASRRARVSGRFALTTQKMAVCRYPCGWDEKNSQAPAWARNRASCSASSFASCRFSYE